MKITNKFGPNITVMLPGSCNAFCSFCFWNRNEAKIRPPKDYLPAVFDQLEQLPDDFRTLSISGGEPTLSPWFGPFLAKLSRFRRTNDYQRVVLTTHGGNLFPFVAAVGCAVDHINISRHGIGTAENVEIFGTKQIPEDAMLLRLIAKIHEETSCDVTFNCVIQEDTPTQFCRDYIAYAKSLGADAVSFRKAASNVAPSKAERAFVKRYGKTYESDCPVCRGMEQNVEGFAVRWKGSVLEPSIETSGVYEVVFHPDGQAYSDWGMKYPLDILAKAKKSKVNAVKKVKAVSVKVVSASGCGRSSSTSGCGSSGGGGGCGARSSC